MIKNHASRPVNFCQVLVCICKVFLHRKQGFICSLDSLDAAADKLCEILENEGLYSKLSTQVRDRFVETFPENNFAQNELKN
jgi:hypothetical protein